jgi:serine phosphatase RsbU (regulator of sigma subunit)
MGRHSRRRLLVRISLLVAVGAALVAGGVALLLGNTAALRSSAQSSNRTDAYLLRVVNVERLVVDAETGLRGEVITGRRLFLQPLYRAQTELPAATRALEESVLATRVYRSQAEALMSAVTAYMSGYLPRVVGLAESDLRRSQSFAVTLQGKYLVDAVRTQAGRLEQLLSTSQSARQRSAHSTATTSIDDAIAVLVLLTLLTVALGGYLGRLVVDRERASERIQATARTLQESILPPSVPPIAGCELAVRFIPGKGPVSGDFYDVLKVEPDTWAVLIGDVCGKGAPAAAATAMARWTLRSSLSRGDTPSEALRLLNDVMLGNQPDDRFITAACLKLCVEPGLLTIDIVCAGHPAPVLVPAEGLPSALSVRGDLLGVMPDVRLETTVVQLRPGDALVAYTDGVTDQGSEVRLSPEQALRERSPGSSAEELAGILEDLSRSPIGRHPDDIAIVALRFVGQKADVGAPAPVSSAGAGVR